MNQFKDMFGEYHPEYLEFLREAGGLTTEEIM